MKFTASIATPERNGSGTYTYSAQQIYRPQAIDELQRLIATAPSSLHALGTWHSFNDVADAAGLIALEALQPAFATAYFGRRLGGHGDPRLPQCQSIAGVGGDGHDHDRGVFRTPFVARAVLGRPCPEPVEGGRRQAQTACSDALSPSV